MQRKRKESQSSCPHLLRASTPLGIDMHQGVDGRDFRREDGAEPVIGPRFARTRWRLSPGHDEEGMSVHAPQA